MLLEEYDFDLVHVRGSNNIVAVFLSREPQGEPELISPIQLMCPPVVCTAVTEEEK